MTEFLRVPLTSGASLSFRVNEAGLTGPGSGPVQASRAGRAAVEAITESATTTFADLLDPVRQMSEELLAQLTQTKTTSLQVEFGIELSVEAGAVIASTGGACHFTITMKWEKQDSNPKGAIG